MKRILLALLVPIACSPAVAAAAPADGERFQSVPLTDPQLEALRGGFVLPNGLRVALGVATETRLDGQLVLRSLFRVDEGASSLKVFGRAGAGDGLSELTVADGAVASTTDGAVQLRNLPNGTRVALNGDAIEIGHVVGQAFGSVIANTGNDRAIDVATTVDIDVGNATPDLIGSSIFRVEAVALDATRTLTR